MRNVVLLGHTAPAQLLRTQLSDLLWRVKALAICEFLWFTTGPIISLACWKSFMPFLRQVALGQSGVLGLHLYHQFLMVWILAFILGSLFSASLNVSLLLHSCYVLRESNQILKTKLQCWFVPCTRDTSPGNIRPHLRTCTGCVWHHAIETPLSQDTTEPSAISGRKPLKSTHVSHGSQPAPVWKQPAHSCHWYSLVCTTSHVACLRAVISPLQQSISEVCVLCGACSILVVWEMCRIY